MTDPRHSLLGHLQHAVDAYGGDLPLPRVKAKAVPAPAPAPVEEEKGAATPTPQSLEALQQEVSQCQACKLCEGRKNVVFGEGSPKAKVFFIGEAPGQTEDETGRPFVGRAGQLLDKIIENAMGMGRQEVFIGNVNKCRPPGNRDPQPDEVAACLPYLQQQIQLIRPQVIVTLGRVALWNLLGTQEPMKRMRGRSLTYQDIPVVATWHPAYLLRTPSAKADTWEDIKRVNRLLGRPEVPAR